MHLRNYIKLLFVLMLTISVGLFVFSAYALVAGRAMEKEYIGLQQNLNTEIKKYSSALSELNITDFEKKFLASKYGVDISINVRDICYAPTDGANYNEKLLSELSAKNAECKSKDIPSNTSREEIEGIYKNWIAAREPISNKLGQINSRLYADDSGKGKLDTAILDIFTKMAGIGTAISVLVLILIYRIPETPSERRDEHPKTK